MKRTTRFRFLSIPNKLYCDVRISSDDKSRPDFTSIGENGISTTISLYPTVIISISHPSEFDETGRRIRTPFNPNDSLGLTKYLYPIFVRELRGFTEDMKISDLYIYHGKRLDLNDELADKIRRVFMVGNTAVEFSAVILETDDTRMEGMKIKFNNENSTVSLTINEMDVLLYNLEHIDIDSVAMMMFRDYLNKPDKQTSNLNTPEIDIKPKKSTINEVTE
jgi:hypothetical protein